MAAPRSAYSNPKSTEPETPVRGKSPGGAGQVQAPVCAAPKIPPRTLAPDLHPERARLIRRNDRKWVNGTTLRYYFFDRPTDGPNGAWVGPEAQKAAVRQGFEVWKDLGIGLSFEEVSNREDAEVRVGFWRQDGSWSYVGRDVIDYGADPNERTMNFGWDLTTPYGRDTALHEIGHTLGFPHEHQNPYSGIVWNEPAVYDYFRGPPNNWPDDTIEYNILRKLSPGEVSGSEWDHDSIMHYWFPQGVIDRPAQFRQGLTPQPGLSARDIEWVRQFYPPLPTVTEPELRPFESQRLLIGPGEQINFRIRPSYSRDYRIQTFGESDTVMVLFEDVDGQTHYIDGDDDSGVGRNARIDVRLYRSREYILRIRLYYSFLSGESAVFMW